MMFDELFRPLETVTAAPATNIIKKDGEFEVVLAVAGYHEDQIQLSIEEGILNIHAEVDDTAGEEIFLRREIHPQSFHYRVELPADAQTDGIEAEMQNGLLAVRIPLQPKKVIPVKIRSAEAEKSLQV